MIVGRKRYKFQIEKAMIVGPLVHWFIGWQLELFVLTNVRN